MKKHSLVPLAQSNALTEGRYEFSRLEMNALYCIIRQVRKEYVETPSEHKNYSNMRIVMPESVLMEIADETHKKDAKAALISLRHRDVTLEDEYGNWMNTGFITMAKYESAARVFTVEVSSEIMPHFVELASRFTEYSLTVAIALKSKWAQRFYELCCQYRNHLENGIPRFHKSVEQLRHMFVLEEKYPKLPDLKKFVIDKAQKELKEAFNAGKCDVWFDYNQNGRGETASFDFLIHTKEETKAQKQAASEKLKAALAIYKFLLSILKRDAGFCAKCHKHLEMHPEKIMPLYDKLSRCKKNYSGADLAKIVRFVLAEDFQMSKKTL